MLSSGYDTPPANYCCNRWISGQGDGRSRTVARPLQWYGTKPYFPQSSAVLSQVGVAPSILVCSTQIHSARCSYSLIPLGFCRALTWGGCLGVPLGSWCHPPDMAYKVRSQAIPRTRGPHTAREGRGSLLCNYAGWLILFPPMVGWDSMGYNLEPLPSYPDLRNCCYSVKLIKPSPCLLRRFIYHVLIPPWHQPACPRHPLRFLEKCIDEAAGHLLHYGRLLPLYVHLNGMDPLSLHWLHYRWVLALFVCPAIRLHPVIRQSARWWNPISTSSISLVTTQIFLKYNITNCATALYISPRSQTVDPVLSSTLTIFPHRLQVLHRFRYTDVQSLLLNAIVRHKYGNDSDLERDPTWLK